MGINKIIASMLLMASFAFAQKPNLPDGTTASGSIVFKQISPPSAPASGKATPFVNVNTGLLSCLLPNGSSCAPYVTVYANALGVKCDGTTDDTSAIQTILNNYGNGGSLATAPGIRLVFPSGHCKISNQLVYEGGNSNLIYIEGQNGYATNLVGTSFDWYGPNFGTMFLVLACPRCAIDNVSFTLAPGGGGKAQNALWVDASNTVTQVVYNISAISRSGNVVTVTTTGANVITPERVVKVVGSTGGAKSFNGTFQVLYCNDSTHCSWAQTGADESGTASTGTVTNYRSSSMNSFYINRLSVSNPKSVSTTLTSITGTGSGPFTITSATAHFGALADIVVITGASDSTYNCAYLVSAISTSTTITANTLPGSNCAVSNAGATGGTLLTGSTGIRIGHSDISTEQVSEITAEHLYMQGDQLGGSTTSIQCDNSGNVKNFLFNDVNVNGFRYGFEGFKSGRFSVWGYQGSLIAPDVTAPLATIDFVNNGDQITITGAEVEATNHRFFSSTANSETVHLDGISFQSSAPTDDLVVIGLGSMFITNSRFNNNRVSGSAPYIQCATQLGASNPCTLVSIGNAYANAAVGGGATAPGYIPVKDGSANVFSPTGAAFLSNKQVNITSMGDMGTTTNVVGGGTMLTLTEVHPSLSMTGQCLASGTAANPSVVTCGGAASGIVYCDVAASAGTCTVNTTAITTRSSVLITPSAADGTVLSKTCNVAPTFGTVDLLSAKSTGTSFTINMPTVTTNGECFEYLILN